MTDQEHRFIARSERIHALEEELLSLMEEDSKERAQLPPPPTNDKLSREAKKVIETAILFTRNRGGQQVELRDFEAAVNYMKGIDRGITAL